MNPYGRHILAEFYQCSPQSLNDSERIERIMVGAALQAGAEVREVAFHRFAPWGVSGVVIISESHLAIHTFPEFGYASVDIYTCGNRINPYEAYQYLADQLQVPCSLIKELRRGFGEITEVSGEWV